MDIQVDPELRRRCPSLQLGCVQASVVVGPSPEELLERIDALAGSLADTLPIDDISRLPQVQSTREAYKATGKKPGRYRPSAEALLRRVVSGKGLYRINNVVDLLNYLSISTGYSIGGYDFSYIQGPMVLGIGQEGEPYEAIARGELNIGGLPVFRDRQGPFGTPTSDSERTRVRSETSRFLMVIFNFGGHEGLDGVCREAVELLGRYAAAGERDWQLF